MKKHNAVFNQWKSQNKTQRDLRLIASLNCFFDSKRFLGNNVFASVDKYYIKRIIRNIRSDRAFRQLFFRDYSRAIYLLRDYLKYVEATENLEAKNVTTTIFADKSVTEATTDNNTVDANEKKETKPDLVDDSAELVTEVFVNVETSTEDIINKTFDEEWWSYNLNLWTDFDFEKYPEIIEQLHNIVRNNIPKSEVSYCESTWEFGDINVLCSGIQWNCSSLSEIQSFLDKLNKVLLPIKDEVNAGGEGTWEVKNEFAVATWEWTDQGFKVKGCLY